MGDVADNMYVQTKQTKQYVRNKRSRLAIHPRNKRTRRKKDITKKMNAVAMNNIRLYLKAAVKRALLLYGSSSVVSGHIRLYESRVARRPTPCVLPKPYTYYGISRPFPWSLADAFLTLQYLIKTHTSRTGHPSLCLEKYLSIIVSVPTRVYRCQT